MTSTAKPTTKNDINTSGLVDAQQADAGDVLVPINDTADAVDEARSTVSVSDNDTHVKTLTDALQAGTGVTLTENNNGGDETLTIAVNPAAITGIDAGNIDSGTLAHERGGLEADVSAYDGIVKISGGTTSEATPGTDYVTPTGSETLTNKTLDGTNDVDMAALAQNGASTGDVPTWGGSEWSPAAPQVVTYQPLDLVVTAGEALSLRDVVYVDPSDGEAYKIDTDATPVKVSALRGVVIESTGINAAAQGYIRITGEVSGFSGLTAGQEV
jgi:hypothetical protein